MQSSYGYVVVVTCVVIAPFKDRRGNLTLKALLLKRDEKEEEGPGLWTIPGGRVEQEDWGEPAKTGSHIIWRGLLARAAKREVLEETGIVVAEDEFVFFVGKEVVFIRKSGMPTLVFRYVLRCGGTHAVRLYEGATEYQWVSEEEIDTYPCIGNVREDVRETLRACSAAPSLFVRA